MSHAYSLACKTCRVESRAEVRSRDYWHDFIALAPAIVRFLDAVGTLPGSGGYFEIVAAWPISSGGSVQEAARFVMAHREHELCTRVDYGKYFRLTGEPYPEHDGYVQI